MRDDINFPGLIEPVARRLLGEPNSELSDRNTLRFGGRGSVAVEIAGDKAGTWYDHEAGEGGGVLDLIRSRTGLVNGAAIDWLASNIDSSIGVKRSDSGQTSRPRLGPIVAIYDYLDQTGELVFQVTRHKDPKDFRQRQPDGRGGWTWRVKGLPKLPYRLPELLASGADTVVFVAEGEKDIDRLRGLGLTATCNAGGAGKWRAEHAWWLKDRHVVILPDNDPQAKDPEGNPRFHPDGRPVLPGQDHAAEVARSLRGVAASLKILMLPDLPLKGDVSDWIEAGGTAEQLLAMAADAPAAEGLSSRSDDDLQQRYGTADVPTIRVRGGDLHLEASAGEAALIRAGKNIFQRGKKLVRPAAQEVTAARGRTALSACLIEITQAGMVDNLCSSAVWERFDGRSESWVQINPPKSVAETILARSGQWTFPRIAGVITTPTLRADGSILAEPGYDEATRLFLVPDPNLALHPGVANPTRELAERALAALNSLLDEFPFIDAVSRSVALSGLITPVARGAMPVAPMHAIKAHTAGTGKSYMADTVSAICTGQPCPVTSAAPDDEGETEKRLVGLLMGGYPICSLDNVNGELGGDLLCQAIERPIIRIRLLGKSDIFEVESRATFFATGNNLRVRGDMVRRTVVCSLDANMERPELREFKGDPVREVLGNRGRYVSACLIIVRAYIEAGRPGLLKPIASFEDWSNTVRSALVWLGCSDPADSMEEARKDDPETSELSEMLSVWHQALGEQALTVQQIIKAVNEKHDMNPAEYRHPALRELLRAAFEERGEINTRRFGNALKKYEGVIVAKRRFKRADTKGTGGLVRWQVAYG
ncbi:topoisomerase [Roseococcus sp. YIM B11640]|uniref:topoisomerase n=1 Tax=Roseococcus sp. YIM B11640 TaxID=3133973 RepID=UPI003C7C44B9